MSQFLTKSATILCTHGGSAMPIPSNFKVKASQSPVLLESDATLVSGCPFNISGKPSPCVRIEWSAPAVKVKFDTGKPLTRASVGKCISAEGAMQGIALIVSTQLNASAQ